MNATTAPPIRLDFSHVGIFVHDVEKMTDFYSRVLGFAVTDRGILRGHPIVFTSWNPNEHHQVVLVGGRPADLPFNPINQLSFRVPDLETLRAVYRRVKDEPLVSDMRGVNHGNAWALYFRDPETNRIEIFCDTDWYISQPCVETLDLSETVEQIRARTLEFCQGQPGFKPMDEWREQTRALIAAHTGQAV